MRSGTDVVVSYLPTGSQCATEFYAERAIEAGCGFINCIPVFVASNQDRAMELDLTDLILRSRAQHGVSKDGRWQPPHPWPSFETPTFGRLLRTRSMDDVDMISHFGNARPVSRMPDSALVHLETGDPTEEQTFSHCVRKGNITQAV